jgi:hypothetical protein
MLGLPVCQHRSLCQWSNAQTALLLLGSESQLYKNKKKTSLEIDHGNQDDLSAYA